jgi:hypothetical protein
VCKGGPEVSAIETSVFSGLGSVELLAARAVNIHGVASLNI